MDTPVAQVAPVPTVTPTSTITPASHSLWDAFEHILLFISLYTVAMSLGIILNFFVDKYLPSTLNLNPYASVANLFQSTIVRGAVAALIVSYPFFAFLFLNVTKKTKNDSSLRSLKSRKLLIYLTLIITFIIAMSNVIQALYTFLSGEISFNFVLHLVVTLVIAGTIFIYYLTQVKEDRQAHV